MQYWATIESVQNCKAACKYLKFVVLTFGEWAKNEKVCCVYIKMVNILVYHHMPSYCVCHEQVLSWAVKYAMPAICIAGELKYFTTSVELSCWTDEFFF